MTIPVDNNDSRKQYTATGGQTVFPYDFKIQSDADLLVERNRGGTLAVLVLTTEYTVDGEGEDAGGNVTLVTGATLDDLITISLQKTPGRAADYQTEGDFEASVVNDELDALHLLAKQQQRDLARTLRLQSADADVVNFSIPLKDDRAGLFLAFGVDGEPVATSGPTGNSTVPVSAFIETLLDDADAAAAQTTLGGTTLGKALFTIASATAGFDALSPMTTLLDLIAGGASGTGIRVPGGTALQSLRVNAAASAYEFGQSVLQVVHTQTGVPASGTTVIPHDNTIPQSGEGDQYMSLAFTPKHTNSKVYVDVVVFASNSSSSRLIAALFQDSGADALAVGSNAIVSGTLSEVSFRHELAAGHGTSAITFKVRAGGQSAGTTTFNYENVVGSLFDETMGSSITVWELSP